MFNWSVDTKRLRKDAAKYTLWRLEQSINYGLGKDKLNYKEIRKYFNRLDIDADKRVFLSFILYGKKPTFS
ncbi:hypothetical protein HY041_03085 [Candidatus Roizmanbacteria bacterium]|nr:hypothetical protein [Candidatus Roizmanbacteria bacterium]